MSQYKSTTRSQPQDSSDSKYRSQARTLQELFPAWSNDDLQTLLEEVNGDVQQAAGRITDGTVEQWGEVSRKKDKKAPTPAHTSKPSVSTRGDSRGGGRGGRGGRGGSGRGGAVTRGRGTPRAATNGHAHHSESSSSGAAANGSAEPTKASGAGTDASAKPSSESNDQQNGGVPQSTPGWTDASSSLPDSTTASPAWGASAPDTPVNGNAVVHSPPTAGKQTSKTPATSKMSWAQIARPHEKAAPAPAPVQPSTATPLLPQPPAPTVPESEPHRPEPEQNGWEEPTTGEAPSWDEPKPSTTDADIWPPSTTTASEPLAAEPSKEEISLATVSEVNDESTAEPAPAPPPEIVIETKPEVPKPSPATSLPPSSALPRQVATPSPKLTTRPAVSSHRSSARYKIPDQPVTMPLSFGTGIEKVGMQFGSLSLGGDSSVDSVQTEPEAPAPAPEVTSPTPKVQVETVTPVPPPATAPAASTSLSSVFQQQQPTPQLSQPQSLPPPQSSIPHHTLPTSISQPIPTSQNSTSHAAAASPLQQFAQQQASSQLTNVSQPPQQHHQQSPHVHQQTQHQTQHIPHLPQQLQQSHTQHSYNQHGLPTHLESSQPSQTPIQQQALQTAAQANYFRGADASSTTPYFHASTPPAPQSQDTAYASFNQLGGQGQHQQASHLGNFNNSDYGYTDNSRGFYENYAQQSSFGSRNPLGHDDIKSLPGSQQSASSALPASTTQAPQGHSSQATTQPQPTSTQGPQQSYPPPVPYYYTHAYPQNQYYGTPYSSGYVPQPFVKYPTMFQPGPPGPGSAANPATKQAGGNVGVGVGVQPQSNPYNQGLYQQGAYDDYQAHPHHSQHQHQHNHSLGLGQGGVGVGSGDYGKQLYGGGGQGGMQGFMGLGGQTSAGGSGPASNAGPRAAASPETPYKPYAAKDVGVSSGRGAPVQQGPGQGQPQGQGQGPAAQGGPQGQGFYGGNRFAAGVGGAGAGGVSGGPQQGGHHQQGGPQGHLGYPQGGNEPNFYGYQPRQQQGYWQ